MFSVIYLVLYKKIFQRDAAIAIISDENWMLAMQSKTKEQNTATTPMRKLICKLPGEWQTSEALHCVVAGNKRGYWECFHFLEDTEMSLFHLRATENLFPEAWRTPWKQWTISCIQLDASMATSTADIEAVVWLCCTSATKTNTTFTPQHPNISGLRNLV